MFLARPSAPLAPFVACLWSSAPAGGAGRERVLPSGHADLVVRLAGGPVSVFRPALGERERSSAPAVLIGAGSTWYDRYRSSPGSAVGAHFQPGGAAALFGVEAGELADRHVELEALWGSAAEPLRERLLDARSPQERLARLDEELCARAARVRAPSARWPAVACALRELARDPRAAGVDAAWRASGFSRRHFAARFEGVVGLTPKLYARVRRFQAVLRRAALPAHPLWIELAHEGGFHDQPHLNRDFWEFAGMAPGAYRAVEAARPSHAALPPV